jgi:trk system potassium uptake protein TrkA
LGVFLKIFIVGAGEVGYNLAEKLSSENHEVTILDKDERRLNEISSKINAFTFVGDGASINDLENAQIQNSDIFVAVTDKDEVNLISCFIANQYNIPLKISRVQNNEFSNFDIKRLGIDLFINTNYAVAKEVENLVEFAEAHEFITFDEGKVILFGIIINETNPFCNKSLIELNEYRKKYPFLIVTIERDNEYIIPKGNDKILNNDHIVFLTLGKYINSIKKLFRHPDKKDKNNKNIFLIGAGDIGIEIAKILSQSKTYNLTIVDKNLEKCKNADILIDNALILNIDALDISQLLNEGFNNADIVISVTNNDEVNIINSIIAKKLGARKTIALIRRTGYAQFSDSFGIDNILSPRLITASHILKYVRRGKVVSAVPIFEGKAEIIEYIITKDTLTSKQIMDIYLPENTIIGAVVRNNTAIIPKGDTMLQKGDKLIIFTKSEALSSLEKIFA